ncbi:PTS sugar transporter subunit IIA [[Mycoplasma] testudinis]|uniref:PTS sugar transporter subunit IIA n=1 Tax=[Mycoplasma] testudinis TaxID=33924 RepID=UPI0004812EAA|nr:glucose PTS transporter subunit IIA [[Mycoplasma] testudinis]
MFNFLKNLTNKKIAVKAFVDGEVVPLKEVGDGVFSEGMIGEGFAMKPASKHIVAPVSGTLSMVFATGHAYGISIGAKLNFLLHLGIDTVNLKGEGFSVKVNKGQAIIAGQTLCSYDYTAIASKVTSTMCPFIIPADLKDLYTFEDIKYGPAKADDVVAYVVKKK